MHLIILEAKSIWIGNPKHNKNQLKVFGS